MDPWQWFTQTIPAGGVVSGIGVGAFVAAILTDRLMTQGQHLRRVADLTVSHEAAIQKLNEHHERERLALAEHHKRELAEKDARLADLRESRDIYKEAATVERARADTATSAIGEISGTLESVLHVMQSLDRALPAERGSS